MWRRSCAGRRRREPLAHRALEQHHDLDVRGVGHQIERLGPDRQPAAIEQHLGIAREGRGVARHVDDALAALGEPFDHVPGAGARRIQQRRVEPAIAELRERVGRAPDQELDAIERARRGDDIARGDPPAQRARVAREVARAGVQLEERAPIRCASRSRSSPPRGRSAPARMSSISMDCVDTINLSMLSGVAILT